MIIEKIRANGTGVQSQSQLESFLPFYFILLPWLTDLRRLPDGGQVIGCNGRNVFGDRIFL